MTQRAILSIVVATALYGACAGSPTTPAQIPAFSKTDLTVGTGATAASGNTLSVNYTGWLYDPSKPDFKGLQFDASAAGTPFQFTLGAGQVIAGWDQGLTGMNVGGVRRLVIPPSLGYGEQRSGKIPPNAALVFDIELVSVS